MSFDWGRLTAEDRKLAESYMGYKDRIPDLVIDSEQNGPYLYRWHIVPRSYQANVYFHVQISNDPERPLHDHPWDNMSVILSGGYDEILQEHPPNGTTHTWRRRKDDVVQRSAHIAHRLLLPKQFPYTMTLFATGPAIREWGFWVGDRWYSHKACLDNRDGHSYWKGPTT